jgi:hypothetical protein
LLDFQEHSHTFSRKSSSLLSFAFGGNLLFLALDFQAFRINNFFIDSFNEFLGAIIYYQNNLSFKKI